ncbi:polyphosphate kinase 1 [uncultured Treponema sp.]|uniref:polyphosphate kinase 1 n=1 Tax=uncultured Treponema sp. TaxID=162155 RepID=UPI0025ED66CE|nr:polyphosphate kinase 1 [uncultured Treponema sp.]
MAENNVSVSKRDFCPEDIPSECYVNRELSWLSFNERVLDEAGNPSVPIAERLSFVSIFQSNLDEFFMVRVGSLRVQEENAFNACDNKTKMTASDQIAAILLRIKELEIKKAKIYEQLMGELEVQGIRLINFNKLSDEEGKILEQYFDTCISPFLSPMIVGKQQPFPFLANKELNAVVLLSNKNGKNRMGIVPCTNTIFKRLIEIPSRPGTFMLCEELILHFATKLFTRYSIREKAVVRITRNADIDEHDAIDEDLDYRNFMEDLIKQRKRMSPVRLELSRKINPQARSELAKFVKISEDAIIDSGTPLDMKFVFQLREYLHGKNELFYRRRLPRPSRDIDMRKRIIPQIEKKDVLLFYPFENMKPFLGLLHEAASDESVVSIKITLYRLADKSKIVEALVEAAENGKEVVVLVELRARFDEANNIEISRVLEDSGCRVIYGLGEYKVHSKLCLITRNTGNGISYITQIGTGNYNEKTAELYTDFSLLTANSAIGSDAAKVFKNFLLGEVVESASCLLVAPKCFQSKILEFIHEEIQKKAEGKEAYIGIKINSLTDKPIIDALIEASRAGVKIDMCVRGICCLIPGIAGWTENIRIVSIVGRYLEHSRIYWFGKGEDEKVFIGSADFMTRNMVRRVEVGVPVLSKNLRTRIKKIFEIEMNDTEKGRVLDSHGIYEKRNKEIGGKKKSVKLLNSQEFFFDQAYKVARSVK